MKKLFLITLSFLSVFSFNAFTADEIVSPFAGKWYSSNKEFLQLQIGKYLDNVKSQNLDNVVALILPHAAYLYAGQTAAYGIKEIAGKKYSRVIIMGPSHYAQMINMFSVPDVKCYKTPIGTVEVDTDFVEKLKKFPEFNEQSYAVHYNEHSTQMAIPMLQTVLTDFKIVPIIVGNLDTNTIHKIADQLRPLIDKNTLVVASSDFTHYGNEFGYVPFPADTSTETNLKSLDMKAVSYILKLDFDGFYKFIRETQDTICGIYGIEILMLMLPDDSKSYLLNYDTFGRITGNFNSSVSYVSIAFTGKWAETDSGKDKSTAGETKKATLSDNDKNVLLSLAKRTIEYVLENGKIPTPDQMKISITESMKEKRGVFVTLKEKGELRGCVGEIFPTHPLYEAVIRQAINAAFADTRFYPVTKKDFPGLSFEISVLTPPQKVKSWENIVIGKDGMVLTKDGHSAVFLPQVAPEQGWDLKQTLTHLSTKAELPPDAWKEGAEFMTFQADVFDMETDAPLK